MDVPIHHFGFDPPSNDIINMATTRLRQTFTYPSEDNDDDGEHLDEEHQEKLIADLQAEDAQKNDTYRKLFVVIPIAAALFCLSLILFATTARQRLIALLSFSSLLCTAYILHYQPIVAPERKGKKAMYQLEAEQGPVEKYLVYLNAALATVMLLAAVLSWRQSKYQDAWREALPAIIFGLTMFARQQLAPLDFEDLHKARYEYKGA